MINGFIVIDKPSGLTSHDVVNRVRRIIGTRKAGHTGTLDPFATGVLPVAVNSATRIIPFLDEGIKIYEALLCLGVTTNTLDMTGTVLSKSDPTVITREIFISCCEKFTGSITQIPPMYSAIKQNGQPLYKLARQGVEVERKSRDIEIFSLELLSFAPPFVSVRVTCSRGTYIRTLADDIGRELGCGAALQELRRTASGSFCIENAVTLTDLETAVSEERVEHHSLSQMSVLEHLPEIELSDEGYDGLRFGRSPGWGATVLKSPFNCLHETVVQLTFKGNLAAVATLVQVSGGDTKIVLKRVLI